MTDKPTSAPPSVVSVWPALAVIAFGAAVALFAQSYSPTAARFPTLVGIALCVLGGFDLYSRLTLPGAEMIRAFWGAGFEFREMSHTPRLRDEVVQILWVVGAFVGMAVIGILPALPLFCLLYTWKQAKRPLLPSAIAAVILLIFLIAVFEWLLSYELYRGLLLSKGGLARW